MTAVAFVAVVTLAGALGCLMWLVTRLGWVITKLAETTADLRVCRADLTTQTNRADAETRRADALDSLLDELPPGDAAGARDRMRAFYVAGRGDGAGAVPAQPGPAAVEGVDRDGLLRPGAD